jgi:hypothetical protein
MHGIPKILISVPKRFPPFESLSNLSTLPQAWKCKWHMKVQLLKQLAICGNLYSASGISSLFCLKTQFKNNLLKQIFKVSNKSIVQICVADLMRRRLLFCLFNWMSQDTWLVEGHHCIPLHFSANISQL